MIKLNKHNNNKYRMIITEKEFVDDKNKENGEFNMNTIKEGVLRVEFERIFDKWGMRIVYQDDIFERGTFIDNDIKVSSNYSIEYYKTKGWLYILGNNTDKDDDIIIVTDEEKEIIENKIKLINKKYGIEKRWRARKEGIYYFIVGSNFYIGNDFDVRDKIDDERYNIGNYFETEKLAVEKLKEIKELLLK